MTQAKGFLDPDRIENEKQRKTIQIVTNEESAVYPSEVAKSWPTKPKEPIHIAHATVNNSNDLMAEWNSLGHRTEIDLIELEDEGMIEENAPVVGDAQALVNELLQAGYLSQGQREILEKHGITVPERSANNRQWLPRPRGGRFRRGRRGFGRWRGERRRREGRGAYDMEEIKASLGDELPY